MNATAAPRASTEHLPLPRRGTMQRERDGAPLTQPCLLTDYPVRAACTGCTATIRKETQLRDDWKHLK